MVDPFDSHDVPLDQRRQYRSQLPRLELRPVRGKLGGSMQHVTLLRRGLGMRRERFGYAGRLGEELADAAHDELLEVAGWDAQPIYGIGPALADQRPGHV